MCTVTKMAMAVSSRCDQWCYCNCVYFSEPSIECCLSSNNNVICCGLQSNPGISCNRIIGNSTTVPSVSVSYHANCFCDCCDCCETTIQKFSCSYSSPCSSSTISSYVGTLSVPQAEPHITSVSTFISTVATVIASKTPSVIINNVPSSINPSQYCNTRQ